MSQSKNPSDSKHDLIVLFQQGNMLAFEHFFDLYSPALFGLICRIVKDHELAGTILHQSFVDIWQNKGCYNSEKEPLYTWMTGFARRNALAATGQKVAIAVHANESNHEASSGVSGQRSEISVNGNRELEDQILELMYVFGRSGKEVCQLLNIPAESFPLLLKNSLKRLNGNTL